LQNSRTKKIFTGFLPAISQKSKSHIHETVCVWSLKTRWKLTELAIWMDALARDWVNCYGKFYQNNMKTVFQALNQAIIR
jgi:hypothetical protein